MTDLLLTVCAIAAILLIAGFLFLVTGHKKPSKICFGILCSILCILWLIQLLWGSGWRIMHLLFFIVSALIAIWCFVSIKRKKA